MGCIVSNNTDRRRSCVFVLCAAFVCLPYANAGEYAGECIARHANTNAPGKLLVHFCLLVYYFGSQMRSSSLIKTTCMVFRVFYFEYE